jgi:hypothetical protein
MNAKSHAKSLVAALALALSAASAVAFEATQFPIEPSTASRAEVQAELSRARAAGALEARAETYGTPQRATERTASGRSRAEVIAELQRARAAGEYVARDDRYGSFSRDELASVRAPGGDTRHRAAQRTAVAGHAGG